MPIDSKRVADRLRGATPGTFPEKQMPPGEKVDGDNEAGRMLLAAVKAGDAAAVEEAIKKCVGDSSY